MERPAHIRLVHSRDRAEALPDDAELVAGARREDPAMQRALVARCAPLMERVLVRTIGPDRELPDLLHDAFVRLLEALPRLEDPRALPGWATRIATRTALDCLRRRQRRKWLRFFAPEELDEPSELAIDDESREVLRSVSRLLDMLAPEDRIAFALRVIDDRPLSEVAAACDCSLATVKRRVARAQQRFVPLAQADPLLSRWLRDGARWGEDT